MYFKFIGNTIKQQTDLLILRSFSLPNNMEGYLENGVLENGSIFSSQGKVREF